MMNSISAIPAALPIVAGQLPDAVNKVEASSLLAPVVASAAGGSGSGFGASGDTATPAGLPGMSASLAQPPVWENKTHDEVTSRMAVNYASQSLAVRFKGLGATLLTQFALEGREVSQTVRQTPPGTQINPYGAVFSVPQASLHGSGDNQVSFTVTTKSGVHVQLMLDSQAGGLAVQLKADGTLSEAERAALGKLSGAFESAVGGLTQNPPQLKLDGLMRFDPKVLASVDLHAQFRLNGDTDAAQSMDFHADATRRKASFSGPSGTIDVGVDMGEVAALGSKAQQAKAMAHYLQQLGNASTRGHADADLMAMFKDVFVAMHSDYGVTAQSPVASAAHGPMTLTQADHAILTGLADFTASVRQTDQAGNPVRPNEKDTFSYQLSQTTSIAGDSQKDRSITQQQKSHLTASYHLPAPGVKGDGMASQSYDYYQVDDSASSTAQLSYVKGVLTKALLDQSVDRSTRVTSYRLGTLISDATTPTHSAQQFDLIPTLAPVPAADGKVPSAVHSYQWQLADVNDRIFLQA
jgi:hypothetical protein